MSNSDDTTAETRSLATTDRRNMLGMLRRFTVRVTSKGFWQVLGVLLADGLTRESHQAEIFPGIGFYSRPKPGVNAECIVGFPGGPENPCIIATRDEDTRKRVAAIEQDETMAFNTLAGLKMTKDGKILACAHGGVPFELAKADELNDLRAFVHAQFSGVGHSHGVAGAATNSTAPVGVAPASNYPGTTVLKGQ